MSYSPQRQPSRQSRKTSWGGYLVLLVLVGAILFVLSTAYRQQFNGLLSNFEPSCSLREYGATITVRAWSANDDCQKMMYGQDNFTGVIWHNISATNVVDGPVACEMDINGRHVIVRGSGNDGVIVCYMFHPLSGQP